MEGQKPHERRATGQRTEAGMSKNARSAVFENFSFNQIVNSETLLC